MNKFRLLTACLGLCATFAEASILTVDQGFFAQPVLSTPGAFNQGIDVGADADMLIIGVGAELGPANQGYAMIATYGGAFMPLATGNFRHSSIFYLDLTEIDYSGEKTLSVLWDYPNGSSLGVSWVSIEGNLQTGQSIQLQNTASATGSSTVALESSVDEPFTFVNFTANKNGPIPTITMSGNLSEIDATEVGSATHGSGYDINASAGTNIYSWDVSTEAYRRIDAAAFAVVPEPSSYAMILMGLFCLVTRRVRLARRGL